MFIVSAALSIALQNITLGILAAISLVMLIMFQIELSKLKKQADTREW